ncbi:hypothetical protein DPMN_119969 [Dreissena polymorpha]|uniref:Uncharacterized protein n=1 Tax=Dreissena polymorpha TaxID=45954 RepID=A0A9D4JN68_DREPO|nr:hypothetical protein DPMN_119969 [Dreissena polymorpha]
MLMPRIMKLHRVKIRSLQGGGCATAWLACPDSEVSLVGVMDRSPCDIWCPTGAVMLPGIFEWGCMSQYKLGRVWGDIVWCKGDSDSESDAEYAGIEQPPIIHQLKRILDEYRNDVQIIKVRNCEYRNDVQIIKVRNCEYRNDVQIIKVRNCEYRNDVQIIKTGNCEYRNDVQIIKVRNCEHMNDVQIIKIRNCENRNDVQIIKTDLPGKKLNDVQIIKVRKCKYRNDVQIIKVRNCEYRNDVQIIKVRNCKNLLVQECCTDLQGKKLNDVQIMKVGTCEYRNDVQIIKVGMMYTAARNDVQIMKVGNCEYRNNVLIIKVRNSEHSNDVPIIKIIKTDNYHKNKNADDAGATELKVLYEGDTFNHEDGGKKARYRKFFQAFARFTAATRRMIR